MPKPRIRRYPISSLNVTKELNTLEIKSLYGRLDAEYLYVPLVDWGKVFHWIYLTQQLPKSTANAFDCENWAMWLKAMVSLHFGINTCAFIIGQMPLGTHGFNMIRMEDGWFLYEPNPAFNILEPFEILDNYGYRPSYVLV